MENGRPKVGPGLIARDPKPLQRVGYGVYRDAQGNLTTSRGRLLKRAGERQEQAPRGPRAMPMPAIDPKNLAQSLQGYMGQQQPQQPQQMQPAGQQMPQPMPMPVIKPQDYGQQPQQQAFDPEMLAQFMQFLQSQKR